MWPQFYDETNNSGLTYDNDISKKNSNISCKCFNQTNYPIHICKQYSYLSHALNQKTSYNHKSFWDKNKFDSINLYQQGYLNSLYL